jgi:hypothetical protein
VTPAELKTRFRRDVDDIQHGPADESDLLFTSDDVNYYLDEAHRRFVAETRYLHEKLQLPVSAGTPRVSLPTRFLEARGKTAHLATADRIIPEFDYDDHAQAHDDYGSQVVDNPMYRSETGEPRRYTFDAEEGYIYLFPTPEEDDTLELLAFVEPKNVSEVGKFAFKNERHLSMLLHGMKALAYRKQDADAYDPRQAELWEERFADAIAQVSSERMRRRRKPGVVRYGGI